MKSKVILILLILILFFSAELYAQKQTVLLNKEEFDNVPMGQALDGSPWTKGIDPDIDMYMGTWKDSATKITHGTLIERDILTKGDKDSLTPPAKGALLKYINRLTYAMLPTSALTNPTVLSGEQELFYILSGKGVITTVSVAGKKKTEMKTDLRKGICILMPEGLQFTISNTGEEPLTMYLVCEPVPSGFVPQKNMLIKDETTTPIGSSDGLWCMIYKGLYSKDEGFGTLFNVLTVALDPMTIYWPHSHFPGCEEVWVAMDGTSLAWIGKQIRPQPPGTAYIIPDDRRTTHCNMNTSNETVKFFYFSTRKHMEAGTSEYEKNLERSKKK